MAVEYAWRQPDGVIAPVLTTEDYDLMVNILGDWVRVADLIKLALKPGQMAVEGPATRQVREAQECRPTAPCAHCRERLGDWTAPTLGQLALNAWNASVERKYPGNTMATWDQCSDTAKAAWEDTAQAIIRVVQR